MKVNRYGRAEVLTSKQIHLLFTEGFTKARDRALFGICLYGATRINESCTLLSGDIIGIKGIRDKLVIRSYNTKGKRDRVFLPNPPKQGIKVAKYRITSLSALRLLYTLNGLKLYFLRSL